VAARPSRYFWLLRHAKTLTEPPPGQGDHERRLAPRGTRDAQALGARLGSHGDRLGVRRSLLPRLVLCSDATRTTQTAELALAQMAEPPPLQLMRSLYGASPEDVVTQLQLVDADVPSVMVVGHNPTAEELALTMSDGLPKATARGIERHGFATCALAVYRLDIEEWTQAALGQSRLVKLFAPPY
jgi:phosphohistidine phosphatase